MSQKNIIFLSYNYPPDLSAGSFRSKALVSQLTSQLDTHEKLFVITTQPNRYDSFRSKAEEFTKQENIEIYRTKIPQHHNKWINQAFAFSIFFFKAFFILLKIKPDFIVCTTGRHMTSSITYFFSKVFGINYFVDFRDIFSEAISDIFKKDNNFLSEKIRNLFLLFEKIVLTNAKGVNTVSEAFFDYYESEGIDTKDWSFLPNGVDEEFMNLPLAKSRRARGGIILYAGNLGMGQGLDIILPEVCKTLSVNHEFVIIGDGVMKSKLINIFDEKSINNVRLIDPMSRLELLEEYMKCDFLFLHLNKQDAFKRSLPSKVFEYAVIGKPIIAGLSGYSAEFLRKNVPHSNIFEPGNTEECIEVIEKASNIKVKNKDIEEFKSKYARSIIMKSLAKKILDNARVPEKS